jgi:hypothetical protein
MVPFYDLKSAFQFARQLARLGVIPQTTVLHDRLLGAFVVALVNIYGKEDQRRLLEVVRPKLNEPRRQALEDLTLARGPIPHDILERMVKARERGWRPAKIALKMNEQGIIAGMGGVRWTSKKVRTALAQYDERVSSHQQAA